MVGQLHAAGLAPLFQIDGDQDEKNTVAQIAILRQGGLALPNCEYYTKDDDASKKLRAQYEQHVIRMFVLFGATKEAAAKAAETVMRVETALAKVSKTPVQLRDPEGNYHKMSLAELTAQSGGFDWIAYYKAIGLADPGAMDVAQPEFFQGAAAALTAIPLVDWKTYLTWNVLHGAAASLSSDFVNENFKFFGTALRGTKDLQPRWRRVLRQVDGGVGEALGQIYVEKNFPPEAKRRMLVMVGDLKDALREHIEKLDWMSPATKKAAPRKTRHAQCQDRLSRQVARLHRAGDQARVLRAECPRRRRLRNQAPARARSASRSIARNGR